MIVIGHSTQYFPPNLRSGLIQDPKNTTMKKRLTDVLLAMQSISKPLLLISFFAGYLLATMLFTFFGSQMRHLLQSVFS